jgi:hypothetical protein
MVSNFVKWTHNTSHPRAQYCQVSRELGGRERGGLIAKPEDHCVALRDQPLNKECSSMHRTTIDVH